MRRSIVCALLFILAFTFQSQASAATKSREEYEKTGHVFWDIQTNDKLVAITFDDGPHPIFTPEILDILSKYHAKATFFVAGNKVVRFPEVLKREVKEGHEIANHTFHHIYGHHISSSKLTSELEETDKVIKIFTGIKPSLYRPVGGVYNDVVIQTAIKNRKEVVLWSWDQDSRDWTDPPASQICSTITKGIKPGNIILFHDWHGSEFTNKCSTVKALDTILNYLHKNGYKSVTVSELLYHSSKLIPQPLDIYPVKKRTSPIDIIQQ
ncbi:polysaccharide deacetylase family protein [Neobacillus cucumis]|uniref:Chitooligosaccharide deacetylase n=1 Tax=Neobacillus cucumis TaxID=1740721 RepID=A0A2N5HNK6_9BACI|nr:polysaccharide deacetylase family protein [Neobacillus cucumis]PLS07100.1 chitooligosaccharide deacetylase [Neobacillus cucumis]